MSTRVRHKTVKTGGPTRITRSHVVHGRKKKTDKNKRREGRNNVVRGKEVSIRESASDRQIIYGRMRCGGVFTFLDTNSNSAAYLTTGSGDSTINWIAAVGGVTGNLITVTIVLSGTHSTLDCTVVGNDITIRVKSSGGTSQSTAAQVIAKVNATPAAHALVSVNKQGGDGTGLVTGVSQTSLAQGGGTWFHQLITLSTHQIDAVEKLYLDNREVTFGATPDPRWGTGIWANKAFMAVQYGQDAQEAQPDLMAQLPLKWTSTCNQFGCASIYLITVWNQNLYSEGQPDVEVLVRGALCYDPRSGLTVWTRNSALIVADFLVNARYGYGIPYAKINEAALIAAANICDESVSLAAGGSESRYCTDGCFDTGNSKEQILQQLLSAMDGVHVEAGGEHIILAGAYRAPSVTITEDDLRDTISLNTHVSKDDSFNCIRGTFVDPSSSYNETDIPPVKNSTYIAADGGVEIYEDVSLNFVTQACQAQRLLKIDLERVRQGLTCKLPVKLTCFNVLAGDTVAVTLAEFGWSAKVFEVEQVTFVIGREGSVGLELELRETASGIYDWNSGLETTVDLAPNTSLPDPTDVQEPQNVTLTSGTSELLINQDGTVKSRLKVSWDSSSTEFVVFGGTFEIQFKKQADSTWSTNAVVPGFINFYHVTDVQDGVAYDVRIRAVNTLSYVSDWVEVDNHTVLGKTEKPSNVSNFTSIITDDGIKLSWDAIADLDRDSYEIRQDGSDWNSATLVHRTTSDEGTSYTYQYRTAGSIILRVKAIDTSGNYSTLDTTLSLTLTGPNPIQGFVTQVLNQSVMLDWTEPAASTFSIDEYDIYKGDSFATAIKIGSASGTFHTYIETNGGTFTYWVVAIDVGGNRSSEVSAIANIVTPPESFILNTLDPITGYTIWRHCIVPTSAFAPLEPLTGIFLPINTHTIGAPIGPMAGGTIEELENLSAWLTNNGFTTFQDAVDAGYSAALLPGTTLPGYFVMEHDYGSTVPSSFIDWNWDTTAIGPDAVAISPTISTSTDNVIWTDHVGTRQAFVDPFRYLRLRLDFNGASPMSLVKLSNFTVKVNLTRDEETDTVSCVSGDAGGTVVTLQKDFYSIENISPTVVGTSSYYPVINYNFSTINPTSFQVLLFDQNGTRVNGTVSCRVRGALNP